MMMTLDGGQVSAGNSMGMQGWVVSLIITYVTNRKAGIRFSSYRHN